MSRLLAIALLLAAACCAAGRSTQPSIRAATARYADRVAAMDSAGIAAMFAPDGAIVVQAGPPVRGRAAIEQFLDRFKQFHGSRSG